MHIIRLFGSFPFTAVLANVARESLLHLSLTKKMSQTPDLMIQCIPVYQYTIALINWNIVSGNASYVMISNLLNRVLEWPLCDLIHMNNLAIP